VYGGAPGAGDPFAPPPDGRPLSVEQAGEEFVLSLVLPLADRRDMDVVRKGDELVLTIGAYRRVLALPGALRRCSVIGAELREGRLRVRFGQPAGVAP
ncbi:MAG: ArsA family ATPase, partial [Carbonactinosporaceae bacterium]